MSLYSGVCGKPERRPMYRSPGVRNGRVGADVEFIFAEREAHCSKWGPQALGAGVSFEMTLARKYKDMDPMGWPMAAPTPEHTYRYALVGQGRRAGFRIREFNMVDNYGRIRILVRRARARNCGRGELTAFGFASEGDCAKATRLRG